MNGNRMEVHDLPKWDRYKFVLSYLVVCMNVLMQGGEFARLSINVSSLWEFPRVRKYIRQVLCLQCTQTCTIDMCICKWYDIIWYECTLRVYWFDTSHLLDEPPGSFLWLKNYWNPPLPGIRKRLGPPRRTPSSKSSARASMRWLPKGFLIVFFALKQISLLWVYKMLDRHFCPLFSGFSSPSGCPKFCTIGVIVHGV